MIICTICREPMAGSAVIDLTSTSQVATIYLIHLIDKHWEIVERIRATSGRGSAARMRLVAELASEIGLS